MYIKYVKFAEYVNNANTALIRRIRAIVTFVVYAVFAQFTLPLVFIFELFLLENCLNTNRYKWLTILPTINIRPLDLSDKLTCEKIKHTQ